MNEPILILAACIPLCCYFEVLLLLLLSELKCHYCYLWQITRVGVISFLEIRTYHRPYVSGRIRRQGGANAFSKKWSDTRHQPAANNVFVYFTTKTSFFADISLLRSVITTLYSADCLSV